MAVTPAITAQPWQYGNPDPILTQSQIVQLITAGFAFPQIYSTSFAGTVDPSLGNLIFAPVSANFTLTIPSTFANPFGGSYSGQFFINNTSGGTVTYGIGGAITSKTSAVSGLTFGSIPTLKTSQIQAILLNNVWYFNLLANF